jgi:hypothetical protein
MDRKSAYRVAAIVSDIIAFAAFIAWIAIGIFGPASLVLESVLLLTSLVFPVLGIWFWRCGREAEPTESFVAEVAEAGFLPDTHWNDNVIQLGLILAAVAVGAVVGRFCIADKTAGLIVGAFGGLVVGLLGSGTFLIVYRALRNPRQQDD